jgi:hypothetical protein
MERRDLLLDDIKILARALGQALVDLLKLKTEKPVLEAIQQTNEKLKALTNIDLTHLISLNKPELLIELDSEMMGPEVLEELAKICTEIGFTYLNEHQKEVATKHFEKAFWIYELVELKSTTFSMERINTMEKLKELLG